MTAVVASTISAKGRTEVPTDSRVDAMTESLNGPQELAAAAESGHATANPTRPALDPPPSHSIPKDWRRNYQRRLWISDLIALICVVYGTQLVWFAGGDAPLPKGDDSPLSHLSYGTFSAGLIVLWMGALLWSDSRSHRVIGTGPAEYIRVVDASSRLFGAVAVVAFLAKTDLARGFLLISLPLGILMLVLERWLWRQWLVAKRTRGEFSARVLLVGSAESAAQIARELERSPSSGYRVVGACTSSGTASSTLLGAHIPVIGNIDTIEEAMRTTRADTVVVTSADDLPPDKVKQISWNLHVGGQHLVLAPSILDIAGPRLHTRPVAGLPLIHVETPRFSKGQLLVKRSLDLSASILGVIALSPLLALLALSIRLSSRGPVLFRQVRIGHGGREFTMLKYRSMVVEAEDLLENLQRERGRAGIDAGNEVLFKMRNDPRVTPIGRIMRKYSLDELPQLFNVIGGSMSLVGPRPPLPSEVAQYADHVHRRFLVKPGITGLWQVSGRSTLSWEDTVRLDLSYVENWTVLGDLVILAKTARAALSPGDTAT